MSSRAKVAAPLAIVGVGALLAVLLIETGPEVETVEPDPAAPLVRVLEVEPRTVQLRVHSQGTVAPRTESMLLPEVSGRIEWVSPSFVSGGFFEAGEPLVRIDRLDYEVALEVARANLARAESEHARARRELERQQNLARQGVASPARLDDAVNAELVARAARREARARLERAQRDLDRTEISAPYQGRVRERRADVGQVVSPGTSLGTIYAIDWVEVRLPVADDELAFVDLPQWRSDDGAGDDDGAGEGPAVDLRARFAGAEHVWTGRVVRTEGEIDPRSRMVHVIARVEDPYGVGGDGGRAPLAVGLFVEAEIAGREIDSVFVVPRAAMRGPDRVMVADADDRLRLREADVIRAGYETVYLRSGIEPGDRVVVSALEAAVDGMAVRPIAAGTGP